MTEQLSFLDFSTDIHDYLKNTDVTVSKKTSKSANSRGFNIILYHGKKLCLIGLQKYDSFVGLDIREPSDWQGVHIPCSPYEIEAVLDRAICKFIEEENHEYCG